MTESVPRTVSLRRVKKILDEESGYDWNERSGRHENHDDDTEAGNAFGDHEAEMQPDRDEQVFGDPDRDDHSYSSPYDDEEFFEESGNFGDYDGVPAGDADDDDSHQDLLHRIRALKQGKR